MNPNWSFYIYVEKYIYEVDDANPAVEASLESICDSVSRKTDGKLKKPMDLVETSSTPAY